MIKSSIDPIFNQLCKCEFSKSKLKQTDNVEKISDAFILTK